MSSSNPTTRVRPTVVPYLLVEGVPDLIAFCEATFGAEVLGALTRPDGSVMHAEVRLGDSLVMMGEPMGEFSATPGWVFVTVDDCDAVYQKAVAAGGTVEMEMSDMHHAGERYGGVRDPHGNVWWISSSVENVPWDEQQRRIDALVEQELGR